MATQAPEILFISSWYPTRIRPTLGNFVEKHAEAVSRFAPVKVLHISHDIALSSGREITRNLSGNLETMIVYIRPARFSVFRQLKVISEYFRAYRLLYPGKIKPSLVHANVLIPVGLIAFLFKIFKGIPFIIAEHWTGFLPQDPNKPGRGFRLFRLIARRAACLTPVTWNLAAAMQQQGVRGRYSVIPNVVDSDVFFPGPPRQNPLIRILHVSSLHDEQKNFAGILKALRLLKCRRQDFVLDVISDGDHSAYFQTVQQLELSEQVVFHGKKNTSEVADYMRKADFLLLFSNYENFPCVIAEAMSCGLPVLSTDTGGIAEHIADWNGLLTEPENIESLVSRLGVMLQSCRTYSADRIRQYALDHFSYDAVGKKYLSLYSEILNPATVVP